ncbi:hypothetical protein ACO2J1_06210 [Leptospira interrogans]|uniref:hypothetical protein n=1 Tax=Leptospira interrogans TaxID=173 RepID=UPI00029293F8|nr:hypothetical protein [Leptospira interrogans]ASV04845.1 hypothetical protein B2G47_00300 [Leptospira interrogans serovar Canicola]EKO69189.1 hypothetical protein LEP1GSC069_4379 [Leptospira interrogans serovar Canicola str. Fiocruz LV133]EMK15296.1 hypothetical protein LEP1GSC075_3299 [Leptospira interrogans str. Kito]EMN76340.1 hypothetical protein LEP1GSC102_2355 [Leptospira interrogans str. UI 09600]MCH5431498.1 hypothetical protein [Leptospira interrogans serovar Canicola]
MDFSQIGLFRSLILVLVVISTPVFDQDQEIKLTENAYGFTYDGTNFWYLDSTHRSLYRVDPNGKQESFSLNVPFLTGINFDSREGRIFVAGRKLILKVEPNTGGVTERIPVPIEKIAGVTSINSLLYILDQENGKISILDKATGKLIGGFLTDRAQPRDLVFARDSIWVSDSSDGNIYRYNPDNGAITGSIKTPSKEIRGIVFLGSKIFVIDRAGKEVRKVSFVETDRFIASGETIRLMKVRLTFSLNEISIAGGSLGIFQPPTTEHQRIRNLKMAQTGFKQDFIGSEKAFVKVLGVDDSKGKQTLEYSFEVRTQNIRYYVTDEFLEKKEKVGDDLKLFLKDGPIETQKNSYYVDKIFDARLFRNTIPFLKKSLLDSGVPVRSQYTAFITSSNSVSFKDTMDVYIPGFGWAPIQNVKPSSDESSRVFKKGEESIDLFRADSWNDIQSPVFYKSRGSEEWKNLPAEIQVILE